MSFESAGLRAGALAVSVALALLVTACGADDPAPQRPAATPAEDSAHAFEPGHSRAVREYYGEPHEHEESELGESEADYHQPPRPARGGIGDRITLTGTNLGIRLAITVTGLSDPAPKPSKPAPAGRRWVAVDLTLRHTGVAIFESELRAAVVHTSAGGRVRAARGVKAGCSNGFDGLLRIEPLSRARGCLLFAVPRSAQPVLLQLALEQVPPAAGGRWRLR
jgi:hypothetical protein